MLSTLIDAEPGILTINSQKFVFKDGITAVIQDSVQATPADIVENAGDTWDDVMVKITGTPCGEWEALSTLFPYASFRRGQNIYGADAPCTIQTTSGKLWTFPRAAITGSPSLSLSPSKSLFGGGFEVTGIRKDNTPWATAGSLYTVTSVPFTDWSFFSAAAILKVAAAAAWGALASPWDGIVTMDGWDVANKLNLKFIQDAAIGTIQAVYMGETMVAKCRPLNVLGTDIITAHPIQGGTTRRGAPVASASDLVLTGAGGSPVVTLKSACLRQPGYKFGNDEVRIGELGFEAQRTYTTGQPQPLYTLA
jgi:hypothetical protein